MKPYLFIVSIPPHTSALSDLLATAGIATPRQPLPECLFYGNGTACLTKGRAWIIASQMDPESENRLGGIRGIMGWRRLEQPVGADPSDTSVRSREVAISAKPSDWVDAMASLLSAGFQPMTGEPCVIKMAEDCVFVTGYSHLSDAELKALLGVDDVIEVRNINMTGTLLPAPASTNTGADADADDLELDLSELDPAHSG